ncbi:hypothetical protein DAPPUDRAFT_109336 [Daphnia pulex]|uniref:Uncharacterized protein n=1 Tax=Daphnia pulex TaxID=6669 RepID=E9H2Q0_DAPPU|nr:hypothetical protein DAPPUDRAFT_109336 [Daphnia pulex]|eukprot:EFX74023.1 hypothetical protein DAPPUDRAFT_109336 [Daphnia pulex]
MKTVSPKKNENRTNAVNYSVYTEKREELKFPGYICARWKQIKHITTSFFGQKVVVPDKIALETSPLECLTMYESRRCNEQPMTINDNKFFYDQEPVEDGWWLETVTVETINCAVEKIQLYQETEGESFSTPLGIAPATAGSISHNHLTLIWDKTFTVKSEPKARLVESGVAIIITTGTSNKFRMHDEEKELEFHIQITNKRCLPPLTTCDVKADAFDVIGQPKLYIFTTPIIPKNSSLEEGSRKRPVLKEDASIDVVANFQYFRDQLLDNANDLTQEIENLQCEKRKATHERVVSTAQFNGWLAASMVNLPKCTKLSAFGKTVLAITCKVRNVSFAAEVTNCGPQPKFEKYTINRDGWELVPFSPCYWSVGFINFNDKPYAYSNGTWRPIVAQVVVPTQTLAHSFRYNEVKYFDYVHQSNPAYNDALLDSMNVLADIVSTINDHSAGNFTPSHVPRTTNILVLSYPVFYSSISISVTDRYWPPNHPVKGSRQTIPTILDESSLQRSDSPLHKQQESSAPPFENLTEFALQSPPPPPPPEQFDHYPDWDLSQPPPPNLEFGVSFDFPMPPPSENDQLASHLVNHFEHFEFGVNGDWPMPPPLENDESPSHLKPGVQELTGVCLKPTFDSSKQKTENVKNVQSWPPIQFQGRGTIFTLGRISSRGGFCFLEDQSFSSISPKYAISLANGKQIQTALCFIAAITGQEGNFPASRMLSKLVKLLSLNVNTFLSANKFTVLTSILNFCEMPSAMA